MKSAGTRSILNFKWFFILIAILQGARGFAQESQPFHRADEDREIVYWLMEPDTHQFKFSHELTIDRPGQKYAHSWVRKGSTVSDDCTFIDLDSGQKLKTKKVTGKDVNALGYYPDPTDPDDVVVQGELLQPVPAGGSVRIRVMETYTDPERYLVNASGELLWDRTFGRPRNVLTLPKGWMLSSCNTPAIVSEDPEGRIVLQFNNVRNDEIHVIVTARRRPATAP